MRADFFIFLYYFITLLLYHLKNYGNNTAAAITVVHLPSLSPSYDWQIFMVLKIWPLAYKFVLFLPMLFPDQTPRLKWWLTWLRLNPRRILRPFCRSRQKNGVQTNNHTGWLCQLVRLRNGCRNQTVGFIGFNARHDAKSNLAGA